MSEVNDMYTYINVNLILIELLTLLERKELLELMQFSLLSKVFCVCVCA